jgi:hypothetical protein
LKGADGDTLVDLRKLSTIQMKQSHDLIIVGDFNIHLQKALAITLKLIAKIGELPTNPYEALIRDHATMINIREG